MENKKAYEELTRGCLDLLDFARASAEVEKEEGNFERGAALGFSRGVLSVWAQCAGMFFFRGVDFASDRARLEEKRKEIVNILFPPSTRPLPGAELLQEDQEPDYPAPGR